ncbi:MAG: class I SAM-dependent methyltransferase [archaeon]
MTKILTPEEEFSGDCNLFYTNTEVNRYNCSSGMRKTQQELTQIALSISNFDLENKSKLENSKLKVLDIGCGSCFSLEYLLELGFKKENLFGIDPAREMINCSLKKDFNVRQLGFEELEKVAKEFKLKEENKFDLIISISALQWILAGKEEMEIKNTIKKIGRNIGQLLAQNGKCVIQFYVSNEEQFQVVCNAFNRSSLKSEEFIYNKDSAKKRKYFIMLEK